MTPEHQSTIELQSALERCMREAYNNQVATDEVLRQSAARINQLIHEHNEQVGKLVVERSDLRAAAKLAQDALSNLGTGTAADDSVMCPWCYYRTLGSTLKHREDCRRELALAALDAALGEKP